MTNFSLILSVIFITFCLNCTQNAEISSIYRKISINEFDSFDMEDTREINRQRARENMPLLRYNVDLIDFAQQESERISLLTRFDRPDFNKLKNYQNLFVYNIKYTGQLNAEPSILILLSSK
jgi:hypothetical protein